MNLNRHKKWSQSCAHFSTYALSDSKHWSRQRDLNPRPSDYKSDALPTELCRPAGTVCSIILHRFQIPVICPSDL